MQLKAKAGKEKQLCTSTKHCAIISIVFVLDSRFGRNRSSCTHCFEICISVSRAAMGVIK